MKLKYYASSLLLLFLIFFGCSSQKKADNSNTGNFPVENLQIGDIPNDGGDGLFLSWKPLPKEKRVQEYRVYRGIHPDTLFFLASVQVNVKTGVAADTMFFYDSGTSDFLSIESPKKLKYEKGAKGSNLYRGIPRDPEVAARLSESFDLISIMDDSDYYYHSKKSYSADEKDKDKDKDVYAGVRLDQQRIVAALKSTPLGQTPQYKYYYTVVPVDERNQILGIAEPVSASPIDDIPQTSPALYSVAVQDKKEMQLEWDYPINSDDLMMYLIYAVPGITKDLWKTLTPQEKEQITSTRGILVAQGLVGGGALKNNCIIKEADFKAAGLNWEQAYQTLYTLKFVDGSNNISPVSEASLPKVINSSQLPSAPKYRVEDKPMDKGDRLTLTWQEPIVFLTRTTSHKKDGSRLKVNYQINKTDAQDIQNIYFDFYEPGSDIPFAQINEFHQDNIIYVDIPQKYSLRNGGKLPTDSLKVEITINSRPYSIDPKTGRILHDKARIIPDYKIIQYLKPDPAMLAYMPTNSFIVNGHNVSTIKNVVYRKGYRSSNFTKIKSNTCYENFLDVSVGYISSITKPILGFNFVKDGKLYTYIDGKRYVRNLQPGEKASSLALLPSTIDFTYDPVNKTTLNISIYLDEAQKKLTKLSDDIKESQQKLAAYKDSLTAATPAMAILYQENINRLEQEIDTKESQLKIYQENPYFQEALKARNNRQMMRYVASIREPELRKYTYSIVRTNEKGFFAETPPDVNKEGEFNYYTPISNWFDWTKLVTLIAVFLFGIDVVIFINLAKRGKNLYLRPLAGLQEIDNAVGRATEMGRPILYCMGIGGLSDVATIASMGILSQVAKKAAEYDTRLIVPCYDYLVMPIAQEIVQEAHYEVGRPDSYDKNDVFYLTSVQFAYVAGVNGIMTRERVATNFFMGYFAAEALLMTETGNTIGAVQIAGSDAITQIPFFITTCDYTLIGEELYAASAYLNREPMLLGTLKAQDYFKFVILIFIIAGALLGTFQLTGLMQIFPVK
ncbi:MAG TPA: hypothetical protein PK707_03050 [Candidatus Syntrophosphaera thermopropionivorans]|jgi:hypothetical protein|nr:hypothetical protein [Candidatus Syntrophosphaera thermopropionivorans]HQH48039.1 hypothetical protein [Candidatus Syntrophosphaera thermopropionivorans]HQK57702.1 hypothetical protein [Candidatus Syntrophosphaera thermopropionivorans]